MSEEPYKDKEPYKKYYEKYYEEDYKKFKDQLDEQEKIVTSNTTFKFWCKKTIRYRCMSIIMNCFMELNNKHLQALEEVSDSEYRYKDKVKAFLFSLLKVFGFINKQAYMQDIRNKHPAYVVVMYQKGVKYQIEASAEEGTSETMHLIGKYCEAELNYWLAELRHKKLIKDSQRDRRLLTPKEKDKSNKPENKRDEAWGDLERHFEDTYQEKKQKQIKTSQETISKKHLKPTYLRTSHAHESKKVPFSNVSGIIEEYYTKPPQAGFFSTPFSKLDAHPSLNPIQQAKPPTEPGLSEAMNPKTTSIPRADTIAQIGELTGGSQPAISLDPVSLGPIPEEVAEIPPGDGTSPAALPRDETTLLISALTGEGSVALNSDHIISPRLKG